MSLEMLEQEARRHPVHRTEDAQTGETILTDDFGGLLTFTIRGGSTLVVTGVGREASERDQSDYWLLYAVEQEAMSRKYGLIEVEPQAMEAGGQPFADICKARGFREAKGTKKWYQRRSLTSGLAISGQFR